MPRTVAPLGIEEGCKVSGLIATTEVLTKKYSQTIGYTVFLW